jgi:hypothetical protein
MMRNLAWRALLVVGVLAAASALAGEARAQQQQQQATYVEEKTPDGQFVGFDDDPMTAITSNPVGMQLWGVHPPKRFDLMHPRTHFVPELLKTVESM